MFDDWLGVIDIGNPNPIFDALFNEFRLVCISDTLFDYSTYFFIFYCKVLAVDG